MAATPQSYEIRPESILNFVENNSVKLPRFQRKQTWDEKKNFALVISIFKGFPLGVVVINKDTYEGKTVRWLLDGRQRRNAFTEMESDPERIYDWARKFLGFKKNSPPEEIDKCFTKKIEDYLGADEDLETTDDVDAENTEKEETDSPEIQLNDTSTQATLNPKTGGWGDLYGLLEFVRICHQNGLTKKFLFDGSVQGLDYLEHKNGKPVVNSRRLTNWVYNYHREFKDDYLEKDTFKEYIKNRYKINDEQKFLQQIELSWKEIKYRLEYFELINSKLRETKIGVVELVNLSTSDAQTAFKIINTSGTPLGAVEILSAKPAWNTPIKNPSDAFLKSVKSLYEAIEVANTSIAVKWDAPATLISRLKNLDFVFGRKFCNPQTAYKEPKDLSKSLTMGFKLVSAIHERGISKEHIDKLSLNKKINWESSIDDLSKELNDLGKILMNDNLFKYFNSWRAELIKLTSDAICLYYVARVYLDWVKKGKPLGNSTATIKVVKNAKILLDNLFYEYVTRQWHGASDSRVATLLSRMESEPDVLDAVPREKWESLLNEIINDYCINGSLLSSGTVELRLQCILYYHYILSNIAGPNDIDLSIDVDHIIPQTIIEASSITDKNKKMHNLCNLALLPSKSNISKSNKPLSEISDPWLKSQVEIFSGLKASEFSIFSNAGAIDSLISKRKNLFMNSFRQPRDEILS